MIFLRVRKAGSFKHGRRTFNIPAHLRPTISQGIRAMPNTTDAKALDVTQKRLVLCAVCLAALAMPVSFTGPALALPTIASALGGSPLALEWVTNAFMLAFGSCMLVAGTLADRFGRKRIFLVGTLGFTLSSVIAALAGSIIAVDLARVLQGM